MSLADKLTTIADNQQKVYDAGKQAEYDRFWDSVFRNGNRTNFMYGFTGDSLVQEMENLPYVIRPVDAVQNTRAAFYMFGYFNRTANNNDLYDMTELCKKIDMSLALSAQSMFHNAKVKNVTLDLSNVTSVQDLFRCNDGGLIGGYITLTVSEKCTNYSNAFGYVTQVADLTFTDGSVIGADISFANSSLLTDESIQSIINALKDLTGATAKKVTFHTNVVNRLTDEQIAQIAAKNWQLG